MEKYNVENHLFYDGYDLDNNLLGSIDFVKNILEDINKSYFLNQGIIKIIPYFNGKNKINGGISGIILGNNSHFTCHTFSFKNTIFIDYYGNDKIKNELESKIINTLDTNNYDMGSKNIKGNFGKHIIFQTNPLTLTEVLELINIILKEINMTPISEVFINEKDKQNFDILQVISESHISFHRNDNSMVVDVFSCRNFSSEKLLQLFQITNNLIEVNRGLHFIN